MGKPGTLHGYVSEYTLDCERVLVTLLRGLGPWKKSIFLVGGLTSRYLVKARPPDVPPHAGTQDVDIVVDLRILADTEAYHSSRITSASSASSAREMTRARSSRGAGRPARSMAH